MREQTVYVIFMERFLDLMKDKNLNMKQLAEETNIPRSTINSWNLKKRLPSAVYLSILAQYFKVSTDYLLGLEN